MLSWEPEKSLSQSLAVFSLLVQMKPLFVILQKNSPATGMELSTEIKRGSLAAVGLVEFCSWWLSGKDCFVRLNELREEIPQCVQQSFDLWSISSSLPAFFHTLEETSICKSRMRSFFPFGIIYLCETISILIQKESNETWKHLMQWNLWTKQEAKRESWFGGMVYSNFNCFYLTYAFWKKKKKKKDIKSCVGAFHRGKVKRGCYNLQKQYF